ncbi:hypothetical protein [Bradyrhizobium sp. AS23.2]|uniref:hypothetical protein n=1 Tax=Bradyrhizobium sp. AS23.2 TaxID=1680155 RepID=UPI00093EEF75|nr:hypothetical protein [Bradyrhizobium sp. AS23.2]OKO73113.1 hypothetical protein AC630_29535 [Bradyrhizobium sp. AS23.2]
MGISSIVFLLLVDLSRGQQWLQLPDVVKLFQIANLIESLPSTGAISSRVFAAAASVHGGFSQRIIRITR